MTQAALPFNEAKRLAALNSYAILDTDAEAVFDDLTAIAAAICGTPIALMSLIDAHRQWFKSHHGLAVQQTPRELAFCAHAILQDGPFVVPDAMLDARFERNPLTTGAPNVRFYAGTPLITSAGHALGTLCVIDHIPRELTEFQLESLGKLGHLAMCQMELRREREQERRNSRAASRFIANLGQSLHRQMRQVATIPDTLTAMQLTSEQAEVVDELRAGNSELLRTFANVVDHASLYNDQMRLSARPFDLRTVVEGSVARYAERAAAQQIALRLVWLSTATTTRVGDAARIAQVLGNLLDNAIRNTEQGDVRLTVSDGAAEFELCLEVEDTGVGIAPERVAQLFNTPMLAGDDTAQAPGAIGLGLPIVGQLVRLMGGHCQVTSHIGTGTRFSCSFSLPAASNSRSESPSSVTMPTHDAISLDGRAILVAAEDAVSLMLLLRFLQKCNCEVTVASTGEEAAARCKAQAFDLLLVDECLPGMSGYAVSALIRTLPGRWNRNMPIIGLIADDSQRTRALCVEAGMTDHIAKPLSRNKFNATLARCVALLAGADGNASHAPFARSA